VDCGSLLPLWAMQPAASPTALARQKPDETSACPARSRLHGGKRQQAAAVQGLRRHARSNCAPRFSFASHWRRDSKLAPSIPPLTASAELPIDVPLSF